MSIIDHLGLFEADWINYERDGLSQEAEPLDER